MSLFQYRLIRHAHVTDGMRQHIPRLLPFMVDSEPTSKDGYRHLVSTSYDPLFAHELGHVMEIFERGQVERLKLPNLGWPPNNFSTFTAKSATTECKVFAMQWIMEEMFTGKVNENDILGFDRVASFMSCPRFWSKKEQFHGWVTERSVANRLKDAIKEYQPKTKALLDATINYMVDECAEFL